MFNLLKLKSYLKNFFKYKMKVQYSISDQYKRNISLLNTSIES